MRPVNARRFYEVCESKFALTTCLEQLRDRRARPAILLSSITRAVMFAPIFGFNSLMDADEFSRTSDSEKLGVQNISDSLIEKVCSQIPLDSVQRCLDTLYKQVDQHGLLKLKLTNQAKPEASVAHVDATHWMTHDWVFMTVSGCVEQTLRLKWIANIGKELKEAQKMVWEAIQQYGPGFVDIITFDGKCIDYIF